MTELEVKSEGEQQSKPVVQAELRAYGQTQEELRKGRHPERNRHDDMYDHDMFEDLNRDNL